jgi:hypothetical protein
MGMGTATAPGPTDSTSDADPDAPTDADSIVDPFNDDLVSGGGASAPAAEVDSTMGTVDAPDDGSVDTNMGTTFDPAPVDDGAGGAQPASIETPAPMDDFDAQISAADQIDESTDSMFNDLDS